LAVNLLEDVNAEDYELELQFIGVRVQYITMMSGMCPLLPGGRVGTRFFPLHSDRLPETQKRYKLSNSTDSTGFIAPATTYQWQSGIQLPRPCV